MTSVLELIVALGHTKRNDTPVFIVVGDARYAIDTVRTQDGEVRLECSREHES